MDEESISEKLESLSTRDAAKKRGQHVKSLRGIRGVPDGEVARIAAAAWKDMRPRLPAAGDSLDRLFGSAFEDGLVAIALLAALVPDHAEEALDIGLDWLDRTDDLVTADALGWFVLGPAAMAAGALDRLLARGHRGASVTVRRAVVTAGLAMTTEPLAGPSAAALRERVGNRQVRFVDASLSPHLHAWAHAYLRDDAPQVRKSLRRLLRAWTRDDPAAVATWADSVRGGLPKLLKPEIERARRRATA